MKNSDMTTTSASITAAAPFIRGEETRITYPLGPSEVAQGYWAPYRGHMVALYLTRGTGRLASGGTSLYLNPSTDKLVDGYSTPRSSEGTERWLEYKVPQGCDTWEVASQILKAPTPPEEISLKDLPVSRAMRTLFGEERFPGGFTGGKVITPANARKCAERALRTIGYYLTLDKEVKRKVFEFLCYVYNAYAEECMLEALGATVDLGRSPVTCEERSSHDYESWDDMCD